MPQPPPPQGGDDIYAQIGAVLEQMVQMAGPEAVLALLQQAMGGAGQGQPAPEAPPPMPGGPKPPPKPGWMQ